jgi:hypothetical protein
VAAHAVRDDVEVDVLAEPHPAPVVLVEHPLEPDVGHGAVAQLLLPIVEVVEDRLEGATEVERASGTSRPPRP